MCFAALNYENVVETGSETEEEDKLMVSEEDVLLNGAGSPASLANHEPAAPPSPRLGHTLMTKAEEEDDEMRDSGVEHVWHENDMLRASVDGTGKSKSICPVQYVHGQVSAFKAMVYSFSSLTLNVTSDGSPAVTTLHL